MKKTISLLLAILMIVAAVPAMGIVAAAEGVSEEPTTKYVVYTEDFEGLSAGASSDLLTALGWYVPEGEENNNIATYAITAGADGTGSALRVTTASPIGLVNDSIVTVFSGDVMSLVRESDYTISYDLTYREGTTNTNGFSTLVYDYNEKGGRFSGHEGEGAAFGYAPVLVCGTGRNNVYYPISGGSTDCAVEARPNEAEYAMTNRYRKGGAYASLYSRIAASLGDTDYAETADTVFTGSETTLINKTIRIRIEVSYENGPSVFINDILVSAPTADYSYLKNSGNAVWNDFITRTDGAAIALLTKHNVVADIDNISVESASIVTEPTGELPELVITELSPNPHEDWAEYIEIYNTTDRYINLAEYSIMTGDGITDGSGNDVVAGNNKKVYQYCVNLGEVLGQLVKSNGTDYYLTDQQLYDLGEGRYERLDDKKYSYVGAKYVENANGILNKIKYVEPWNTRYKINETNDPAGTYEENTYIAPGECVVLHPMLHNTESFWTHGVNGTETSKSIGSDCFRSVFSGRGLNEDTKVIAFSNFNLADNCNRRYYIGKTKDDAGNTINYTSIYVDDAAYDKYIVSWADWCTPLISGKTAENSFPGLSAYGQVGLHSKGYSGVWVYGVDASSDPRRGVLYIANNPTDKGTTHVGKLAGYQQILMGDMYKKSDGSFADLTITEIVPRTYDLVGLENSAFTAMELTNTGKDVVDLYRYALVRTELGVNCSNGKGFTRSVIMKSGNPVSKGEHNGAYYYFIEDHISNPETCMLQPGETVVVWFLSTETYTTYMGDDDFGFDYFREYWTKNGSPQMAMKNADGEYATKVIAVDGHEGETFNADNAKRVFELSPTSAAVYGIAPATQMVKEGVIGTHEVVSVAFLGISACYYDLQWSTHEEDGKVYYVNKLEYTTLPYNMSMRYVAGGAGSSRCAAMVDSMKVQYWEYTTGGNHVWYSDEEGKDSIIKVKANNAMQTPQLGTLNGAEVIAIADHLFVSEEDQQGNVTYRYFDSLRADIQTLRGAALDTGWSNPMLRFDCIIPAKAYSSLAATYGHTGFKVGTLIVENAQLDEGMSVFTREDLEKAGIYYRDIESKFLYRTTDYAVLGASLEVVGDYDTSYTAVSYMEITLADGTVKTYWSPASTTRSVIEVAESAYADVNEEETEIYCYKTEDGDYSRYNEDVQRTLRAYLGL